MSFESLLNEYSDDIDLQYYDFGDPSLPLPKYRLTSIPVSLTGPALGMALASAYALSGHSQTKISFSILGT